MTDETISVEQKVRIERELLSGGFEDHKEQPRVLNARYDAAKNSRWIERDEEILPNGTYRYRVANLDHLQSVDYAPAPVATNPMAALGELDPADVLQLTISYNAGESLWRAQGILNGAEYVSQKIEQREINHAVARAIMSAVSLKLAYGERGNE